MLSKLIKAALIVTSVVLTRKFIWTKRCRCTLDLRSQTIIVTGATSGIGFALARQLAIEGSTVILACRDVPLAERVRDELVRTTSNPNITVEPLDLQSFRSVAEFARRILAAGRPLHALVNNAGIFYAAPALTADGIDQTFQTNYASPFLLTLLLLPLLRQTARLPNNIGCGRIVNLSSKSHQQVDIDQFEGAPFGGCSLPDSLSSRFAQYGYSKFLLVLFSLRLSELLADEPALSVHCVDPGNVETRIFRTFPWLANRWWFAVQAPLRYFLVNTPLEGAQGVLHALRSADRPFYVERATRQTLGHHWRAEDPHLRKLIWNRTRKLCADHLTESYEQHV